MIAEDKIKRGLPVRIVADIGERHRRRQGRGSHTGHKHVFGTVYGAFWAGADDGVLVLTRDGIMTWCELDEICEVRPRGR